MKSNEEYLQAALTVKNIYFVFEEHFVIDS